MILTMQLPNPASALIKATRISSPVHPVASNHPQYNNSSLPGPTPSHQPHTPKDRDFTYLGMEAVSLVMLLLCGAWCRAPVSEKKTPCFKIYDHVQNTHIWLPGRRCPGTGTAWHCSLSQASRFQKFLRLSGRTGRVRRGSGPDLLASRKATRKQKGNKRLRLAEDTREDCGVRS